MEIRTPTGVIHFSTMDLHEEAEEGNLDHVRLLIEQGADKDEGDWEVRNLRLPLKSLKIL